MSQQFHNGGKHDGPKTISNRDTYDYAVVNPPFEGKHRKPLTREYLLQRKLTWKLRKEGLV